MIVQNQQNLKVHFAGAEEIQFADVAHRIGGVNYFLFSVFKFIAKEFGIKGVLMKNVSGNINRSKHIEQISKHSIMDSGLFTLMFGAHAGKRSEKDIHRWYQLILKFVAENGYQGTCVEVDCQKVLGVEKAWEFREKMRKDLPNNRQINVFHQEDGKKGLDRLIEFSDYIAISVPELRALGKKEYTYKLANYIKNKKPEIDIHLLGCTEKKLLERLRFCSSSDSTSWLQANRYGVLKTETANVKVSQFKEKFYDTYKPEVMKTLKYFDVNQTEKNIQYYSHGGFAALLLKKDYTKYAGSQD